MSFVATISWLEEGPFALRRWAALMEDLPLFFESFLYTIGLAIGALILAFTLGTFMRVEDDCFESEKILFGLIDFAIRLKPYFN